jgi:hypothetical protein
VSSDIVIFELTAYVHTWFVDESLYHNTLGVFADVIYGAFTLQDVSLFHTAHDHVILVVTVFEFNVRESFPFISKVATKSLLKIA